MDIGRKLIKLNRIH